MLIEIAGFQHGSFSDRMILEDGQRDWLKGSHRVWRTSRKKTMSADRKHK
jgi:hypothetical protein